MKAEKVAAAASTREGQVTAETKMANLKIGLEILAAREQPSSVENKLTNGLFLVDWTGIHPRLTDRLRFKLFRDGVLIRELHRWPSRRPGDATAGWAEEAEDLRAPKEFINYLRASHMPQDVFDEMCSNVSVALEKELLRSTSTIGGVIKILRKDNYASASVEGI